MTKSTLVTNSEHTLPTFSWLGSYLKIIGSISYNTSTRFLCDLQLAERYTGQIHDKLVLLMDICI